MSSYKQNLNPIHIFAASLNIFNSFIIYQLKFFQNTQVNERKKKEITRRRKLRVEWKEKMKKREWT